MVSCRTPCLSSQHSPSSRQHAPLACSACSLGQSSSAEPFQVLPHQEPFLEQWRYFLKHAEQTEQPAAELSGITMAFWNTCLKPSHCYSCGFNLVFRMCTFCRQELSCSLVYKAYLEIPILVLWKIKQLHENLLKGQESHDSMAWYLARFLAWSMAWFNEFMLDFQCTRLK